MLVPRTRLLILVAVLVVPLAVLSSVTAYSVICYSLIGILLVTALADAGISLGALQGLSITTPPLLRMWKGRQARVDVTVGCSLPRGGPLRLALLLPESLRASQEEVDLQLPGTSEVVSVSWVCTPDTRGRYLIQECAAERASRLGLWAARGKLPVQLEIRVYPDISSGQKSSLALLRRGVTGARPQRQLGRGREFEKLREYASGDGFDEIDWKATARRGHPITRVFQVEKTQEVYVVLDASRLLARRITPASPDTILENNVSATLLLALQAQRQGDLFGLVTFSDKVHGFVRARHGKAHYSACREALYTIQARSVTPDFDEVCALLRLRLRRRALLVFLTELDDPVLAESFVKNVTLLRRQHLVLAAMMRPPGVHAVFEGAPVAALDDVYAHLAGHQQWLKLQELGKVLERHGVHLLLFDAKALPAQLTSSYLNVKQRQLL